MNRRIEFLTQFVEYRNCRSDIAPQHFRRVVIETLTSAGSVLVAEKQQLVRNEMPQPQRRNESYKLVVERPRRVWTDICSLCPLGRYRNYIRTAHICGLTGLVVRCEDTLAR